MAKPRNASSTYYLRLKRNQYQVPSVEARRAYYDSIYAKDKGGRWVITDVPSCFCERGGKRDKSNSIL